MDLGNVAQIASAFLSAIAIFIAIMGPRSRATAEAHQKLEDRVKTLETAQATMTRDLEHMPDQGSFHRIEKQMVEMLGEMKVIRAELKPIAATNSRIQDWMDRRTEAP